jgi:uncharacterized protein (TIGR02246 family)
MVKVSTDSATASDEMEIRSVVKGHADAWNRHDMKALAELFADDAHWVNIVGMHWPGKAAIVKAHEAYHRTFFQTTDIKIANVEIRFIAPGVAAAVILLKVDPFTPPDGVRRPASDDCLSLILARRDGRWLIAHGHNTVIDPGAQQFDPVKTGWPREAV